MLKIGIIDPISNVGGGQRFTGCLIRAISKSDAQNKILFATPKDSLKKQVYGFLDFKNVVLFPLTVERNLQKWFPDSHTLRLSGSWKINNTIRSFLLRHIYPLEKQVSVILDQADILYFPMPDFQQTPLLRKKQPWIVTLHDLIWDFYPTQRNRSKFKDEENIRLWFLKSEAIVTITEYLKDEVNKKYPEIGDRTSVIRHSAPSMTKIEIVKTQSIINQLHLPVTFLFYPASLWIHKNHDGILEASADLKRNGLKVPIVFSGLYTDQAFSKTYHKPINNEYAQRLRVKSMELGLVIGEDIIGLGIVDEFTLSALYSQSKAVIIPSKYEGCNFPLLEAALFEKPILCSSIPVLHEMSDYYGITPYFFNPNDIQSISSIIGNFVQKDDQVNNKKKIACNLTRQNWQDVAEQYIKLFKSVI